MSHPTNEQWMSYLYGEATETDRAWLPEHLRVCPRCQAKMAEWQSARVGLDGWEPSTGKVLRKRAARYGFAGLKWVAAAALFVVVGFSAGRFSSASPEKMRAAIEPEIRSQLRAEFAQTLRQELDKAAAVTLVAARDQARAMLTDYDDSHTLDDAAVSTALTRLETQQTADYLSLKKQLDTVAVLTDAGLRHTEDQVVQLAASTRPAVLNSLQH